MWFKNLRMFRLTGWAYTAESLEEALQPQSFRPGGSQEMQSLGWVPTREGGTLVHDLDGQFLLTLRTEKKLLPATVINQFTKIRAHEIEEQQGYKPGRKQMREIKEDVTDELLPKAFSVYSDTRVWIDTKNHWLVIDTATDAKCDEVIGMLAKSLEPFPIVPLYVELSPASAMTNWLVTNEPPAAFTIDQDAELRSTSESRATVRYVRHSIELDDAQKHVEAGKQCTRLALTWADRISFVLTEGLEIRRVTPLDVLRENQDSMAQNEAEEFDSDFALMSGELSQLLDDLVAALDGERVD